MIFNVLYCIHSHYEHFFSALLNGVDPLYIRCRYECMYHIHACVQTGIQIFCKHSCKTTHVQLKAFASNGFYRLLVSFGRNRKPCFKDIHSEFVQLPCNFELLVICKGDTWCLFTIAQCGIENSDLFVQQRFSVIKNDSSVAFLRS